jgi:hypothetical protein
VHSKQDALRLIGPHLSRIEQCYSQAWIDLVDVMRHFATTARTPTSPTLRARMMYDLVTGHARRSFANSPAVRIGNLHGLLTLTFGSELVVRFKKLKSDLSTTGIPTQQMLSFEAQQEIPGLPPRATFLVAGYLLDATGSSIARLVLTCRDQHGLVWSHDLLAPSAGSIVALPTPLVAPTPAKLRSTMPGRRRSRKRGA